ncbi:MAG: HAD family hydrolase [Bacteroidota bacterium]
MRDFVFVFDKDGVIVDTEGIKLQVFLDMFADYPDQRSEIETYLATSQGLARELRFRHIFGQILFLPQAEEKAQQFTRLSEEKLEGPLREAPLIPGIRQFMEEAPCPMYVCSRALPNEVKAHLHGHHLMGLLEDWYAYPAIKSQVLEDIKRSHPEAAVVFFGDTLLDWEASQKASVGFIGLGGGFSSDVNFPLIPDFQDQDAIYSLVDQMLR